MTGLEIGKSRKIIIENDGKVNSSDAGFLLLQQVEQKHRIIEKLSDFFTDKRDQEKITQFKYLLSAKFHLTGQSI
ncbi:MAG: transposase [Candidatus Thiodiazotropha endolucinida]